MCFNHEVAYCARSQRIRPVQIDHASGSTITVTAEVLLQSQRKYYCGHSGSIIAVSAEVLLRSQRKYYYGHSGSTIAVTVVK